MSNEESDDRPSADVIEAIRKVLDLAEIGLQSRNGHYHVVIIPDAGQVIYQTCESATTAAALLWEHQGADASCMVFLGSACQLTGPPIHLITPDGNFPVSDPASTASKPAVVGRLGAPAPEQVQSPEDEDEDDDDDEDDDFEDA